MTSDISARPTRHLWLGAALAFLTVVTYGNSLANEFVWDDGYIIVENPQTRDLGSIRALALSPDVVKPYYRPVTRTSYVVDHALFGMSPHAFHAVNVAIHLANVLLLFALGLRLFGSTAPAVVAALLLAVHPVNAESVNFVAARNNLLALCFSLVAVHLLARLGERGHFWRWSWLSGLSWFLALLSKESAAAAILFFAGFVVSPRVAPEMPRRRMLVALAPHVAFAAAYLVLRRLALGDVVGDGLGLGSIGRALDVNYHVVPRYLELVFVPARLNLLHRAPEAGPPSEPMLLFVWAALVAGIVLLVRTRSIPTLLGLLWLVANYAPISNVVPIPSAAMAERYLYLPAVGLWIVIGDWAGRAFERGRAKPALTALSAACVLVLAGRTVARNRDWRDEVALFGAIVRVDPASAVGHYNLGCALQKEDDLEGARRAWERTLELEPRYAEALIQLGTVSAKEGDLVTAERRYLAAREAGAVDPTVDYNLALVYERTGRPAQAFASYDRFLRGAAPDDGERIGRALERRAALRAAARTIP